MLISNRITPPSKYLQKHIQNTSYLDKDQNKNTKTECHH